MPAPNFLSQVGDVIADLPEQAADIAREMRGQGKTKEETFHGRMHHDGRREMRLRRMLREAQREAEREREEDRRNMMIMLALVVLAIAVLVLYRK